ncbi:ribosomal protein L16 [Listeria ivanovii FSL F6-596]|nr:ribosomal protein L16 [Listeria ivanovii FSL F6-596]
MDFFDALSTGFLTLNQLESKRRNKQAKTKQKNKLLLAFFFL